MEQQESNETLETVSPSGNDVPVSVGYPAMSLARSPTPLPCPTCGAAMQHNPPKNNNDSICVRYALGQIEPRFLRLSVEKEYAQATGRAETAGLTDRQALQTVLSQPENRYLARQLC